MYSSNTPKSIVPIFSPKIFFIRERSPGLFGDLFLSGKKMPPFKKLFQIYQVIVTFSIIYDKKNKDFFVTCEHIFRISVCQSSETMI